MAIRFKVESVAPWIARDIGMQKADVTHHQLGACRDNGIPRGHVAFVLQLTQTIGFPIRLSYPKRPPSERKSYPKRPSEPKRLAIELVLMRKKLEAEDKGKKAFDRLCCWQSRFLANNKYEREHQMKGHESL